MNLLRILQQRQEEKICWHEFNYHYVHILLQPTKMLTLLKTIRFFGIPGVHMFIGNHQLISLKFLYILINIEISIKSLFQCKISLYLINNIFIGLKLYTVYKSKNIKMNWISGKNYPWRRIWCGNSFLHT